MGKYWLRFGCFLIGYKYRLLQHCSVASEKSVIKYTSAMLLVCLIWGFIGYSFTMNYIHTELFGSILGALLLIVAVIQIERQIILTIGKNRWISSFRIIIGFVIAILGSIIIDQIILEDDINYAKNDWISAKVEKNLQIIHDGIDRQIDGYNNQICENEKSFDKLRGDHVTISATSGSTTKIDYDTLERKRKTVIKNGPKDALSLSNGTINKTMQRIERLEDSVNALNNRKITAREELEKTLGNQVGFLDKLEITYKILKEHHVALFVWSLLFLLFLSIELFILFNKLFEKENDYDKIVQHQMTIRIDQLKAINNNIS